MSAEIALGQTIEIEAVIGTTVIVTDDNAVTDQDGTAVEMTGATFTAKLKERPTDVDADAIGDITVVEASNVLTYTLDDTLTDDLEDGHDYHCVVIATMPADHVVAAYQSQPFAVRRIVVRARAV